MQVRKRLIVADDGSSQSCLVEVVGVGKLLVKTLPAPRTKNVSDTVTHTLWKTCMAAVTHIDRPAMSKHIKEQPVEGC